MKLDQVFQSLLLTGAVVVFISTPAKGEEVRKDVQGKSSTATVGKFTLGKKVAATGQELALTKSSVLTPGSIRNRLKEDKILNSLRRSKFDEATKNISQLSEVKFPATSARMLVQAPTPTNPTNAPPVEGGNQGGIVPITGVKANPTDKGVEIILQTTQGQQLQVTNRSTGNNFVADISGGQLRLPSGEAFTFRSEKPLAGITEIKVTNVDANTVRVTVVGEASQPTVELFDDDTGLVFGVAGAATATQPQPEAPQTTEKPATEAPQEEPAAQQDDPIELVVTGEQDGYRAPNATTATRTDTPLGDIPQSIQVVPRQVIEDQGVTNTIEALRNVPGVVPASPSRRQFNLPIIRGFGGFSASSDLVRRNGLRDSLGSSDTGESASVEQIEVLRGPASVMYGQGSLGGVVNIITKQPLRQPFYGIEALVGNYDFYRGTIDLSGPINKTGSLLYRLNVAAETTGSFIDFYKRDRYLVAPIISWQIGENTKLTIEGEYINLKQPEDFGLPARGTVLANPNGDIPRNRYIGEPSLEGRRDIDLSRVGYNIEHKFSENWQLRNAFGAVFRRENGFNIYPSSLNSDGRTLEREYFDARGGFDNNAYTLDTYTVGNFKTGSIKHKLVAGIEFFRDEQISNNASFGTLSSIDLFNPEYGNATLNPPDGILDDKETKDGLGFYIQDQISFSDNLILVLGGRFDIVNVKNEDFINSTTSFQQNEAFSPRVGIVYKPVPNISLYSSYSRSFQQEIGRTFNNSIFEPQRGTQYEIGVKADFNDRFSANLALYDLTRSNVVTEDEDNPSFNIQTGEQNSQGVELNLVGEILPGWNITTGYAYNNARITKDNTFEEGNRLNNAPENAFSLWTTYRIQKGNLQGLGFGLGLFYIGERQGNLANTFTIPSYLRTDAALFYERDSFRVALNIRNLFDVDYIETAQNALRVFRGDPLTVVGSVSWQF